MNESGVGGVAIHLYFKNNSNVKFISIDLTVFTLNPISEDVIISVLIHLLLRICKLCSGLCEAGPYRTGPGRTGHHDVYRRDVFAQPEMKTKALYIQMNLTWRCLLCLVFRADLFLPTS
jgi:hypothetical protein